MRIPKDLGFLAAQALAEELRGGVTDNRATRRDRPARPTAELAPKGARARRKARRRMQAESRRRNRGR